MTDVATRTPESDVETAAEPVRQRRFTREEYVRMAETGVLGPEDRTELIDGYLVERTAQNAPHRAAVEKVDSQFQQVLEKQDYWVQTQATLPLDCRNVPEPDIAILSGAPDDLIDGEPDEIPLIVEVADRTLTYDRTEKLVCYASNDIPEYWIVNLRSQTLESYHNPSGDEYRERRTLERGDTDAIRRHAGGGRCQSSSCPGGRQRIEDRRSMTIADSLRTSKLPNAHAQSRKQPVILDLDAPVAHVGQARLRRQFLRL